MSKAIPPEGPKPSSKRPVSITSTSSSSTVSNSRILKNVEMIETGHLGPSSTSGHPAPSSSFISRDPIKGLKHLRPPALDPRTNIKLLPWEVPFAICKVETAKVEAKIIGEYKKKKKKTANTQALAKQHIGLDTDSSNDSFIPAGPYPIPTKAAAAVASLHSKVFKYRKNVLINRPINVSHDIVKSHGNTAGTIDDDQSSRSSLYQEKSRDFHNHLINAISTQPNPLMAPNTKISRQFIKSLDKLLEKAKKLSNLSSGYLFHYLICSNSFNHSFIYSLTYTLN